MRDPGLVSDVRWAWTTSGFFADLGMLKLALNLMRYGWWFRNPANQFEVGGLSRYYIYRILYIPGGAGVLPSAVSQISPISGAELLSINSMELSLTITDLKMLWRLTPHVHYIKHGKEKWHHLTNISITEIPKNLAVDISHDICTSSQDKGFRYLLYLRWCTISQSDPSCISRPTWSTATRFPKLVTSPGREMKTFQTGRETTSSWWFPSTHLKKYAPQLGDLPQLGVKIQKNIWSCQHLDIRLWPNYLQLSQVGASFSPPTSPAAPDFDTSLLGPSQ